MARFTDVEERVESPSERRVRYFLAVMFFLQTICTAIPFIQGPVEVEGETVYRTITAFNFLVNPGGYGNIGGIPLAVVGAILVVFPARRSSDLVVFPVVAFFFCVLDSKSKKKFFVSGACAVICAVVITFSFASYISIGAVITLVLNVICLFMSSQGVMATSARMRNQAK